MYRGRILFTALGLAIVSVPLLNLWVCHSSEPRVFTDQRTLPENEFHAYRAVFIAQHCGIDAVAYCSAEVPVKWSAEARVREYGARVKAVLDLFVLNTHPDF